MVLSKCVESSKIKVWITDLEELPLLHLEVQKYIDAGYTSENRIMRDGQELYEILSKEHK